MATLLLAPLIIIRLSTIPPVIFSSLRVVKVEVASMNKWVLNAQELTRRLGLNLWSVLPYSGPLPELYDLTPLS